ncbi:unnamed protein product [marine sediment metagenome]|uniref:Uncharacterized protein n=1 Tax=marine sediment metagenome TaxID=412755 RepID=X1UKX3_9ZZZZ
MTSKGKMKVSKLIEQGKISAEDETKILEAMDEGHIDTEKCSLPCPKGEGEKAKNQGIRYLFRSHKVQFELTFRSSTFFKSFIPSVDRVKLENGGIDMESILADMNSGTVRKLVEVGDENDNDKHRSKKMRQSVSS